MTFHDAGTTPSGLYSILAKDQRSNLRHELGGSKDQEHQGMPAYSQFHGALMQTIEGAARTALEQLLQDPDTKIEDIMPLNLAHVQELCRINFQTVFELKSAYIYYGPPHGYDFTIAKR
jgi:hypothetical protein